MYAVGDAYKVHTECIQAYKESKREQFLFYFFFILSVLLSSTARDLRAIVFCCSCLRAFTDPIKPHCPFFWITVAATFGGR